MIRDNREYRNLGALEARQEEDNYIVEGYASTFDAYPLFEDEGITYYERIEPTAFNFADMSDVVSYAITKAEYWHVRRTTAYS